jgi:hypothetical protein
MDFIKVLKGIACGVIYVSSFFWTMVFTFNHTVLSYIIVLLLIILANVIVGLLMSSESHSYAFYKWLISLPSGIITFLVYRETNFLYYWLNRILPEYGNLTAGGGFALLFFMMFYLLSFFIAITISFYITSKKLKKVDSNKL